jgi:hypothetical protein
MTVFYPPISLLNISVYRLQPRGKPGELVVMYKCVRGARGKPGELVVMYKCVRGACGKPGELVVMYKCVRGINLALIGIISCYFESQVKIKKLCMHFKVNNICKVLIYFLINCKQQYGEL